MIDSSGGFIVAPTRMRERRSFYHNLYFLDSNIFKVFFHIFSDEPHDEMVPSPMLLSEFLHLTARELWQLFMQLNERKAIVYSHRGEYISMNSYEILLEFYIQELVELSGNHIQLMPAFFIARYQSCLLQVEKDIFPKMVK